MPWKGRPPFLRKPVFEKWKGSVNVSMPWKGRPSFLRYSQTGSFLSGFCVNALKGATFISTGARNMQRLIDEVCVNALKGATFISTKIFWSKNYRIIELCQCPERGDLHFYAETVDTLSADEAVSMPWKGRPSFLQRNPLEIQTHPKVCQCPERGDLHFYGEKRNYLRRKIPCVNALKGATFISTLASGNPHK